MSYRQEEITISSYFNTNWTNGVKVEWPNETLDVSKVVEWVRATYLRARPEQVTLGGEDSNLYRHPGIFVVQVFVALNKGTGRITELVDTVCNMFRSKKFSGLTFGVPEVIDVGISGDSNWYQMNVQCSYQRDEFL